MAVRVLVVDDSRFFRRRVTEMLNADPRLEVIGAAENGQEAVEMVATLKPDVVTMDIEMPVMDGITAVRRIMASHPTPILMFSSITTDGAQATLDALDAGAVDFLPKRFEDISTEKEEARRTLCARVLQIGQHKRIATLPRSTSHASSPSPTATTPTARGRISTLRGVSVSPAVTGSTAPARAVIAAGFLKSFHVVAIGSSTGGPVALQEILTKLPDNFPLPIVLVQHMPSTFTAAFAQRLDKLCRVRIKEAADGDLLSAGQALLAPGGSQMVFERRGAGTVVRIKPPQPGQTYRPCVDITFSSLAKLYPGKVLSIILTGMGADGREGIRELKRDNSAVWAQSEETCVVFGMPGAVVEAGLADQVLPLQEIGPRLVQGV